MANTENLRCIRKNIGYVCADGFWSSAEILENSLVLAKMQILQNARCVWLRVGVFAIHFWIDLEIAEFLSSPALFGKEHRPRRRGLKARSNASLSLTNVRELLPKAASAWSVFFFPNVSKNTCKPPPPNTRYISSADFSKTAFVKNNPMKKQEVRVS